MHIQDRGLLEAWKQRPEAPVGFGFVADGVLPGPRANSRNVHRRRIVGYHGPARTFAIGPLTCSECADKRRIRQVEGTFDDE